MRIWCTGDSVCVSRSAGDFDQNRRLRRKLHRQLQQDRDNEWTSRAMEFEKATLLNRQAPSAPELEHVHRPTYAVNEELPTEPEVLTRYHNPPSQEVIRHGPQELSRNLFAACYAQGIGAHYRADQLIKHREETTRDEQAGFHPGRSTIDQVFIVRRVIEIWQQYSKPMQLAFLDFEAAFDSPH
ncbi:hypothetical protein RB195_018453 [Necator americanus]|uniref:Reverse transcriptase domain-containing protein n=1 Tax=Necator americanus TaxID=51031 RepID=A0ABR1C9W1_NECAM